MSNNSNNTFDWLNRFLQLPFSSFLLLAYLCECASSLFCCCFCYIPLVVALVLSFTHSTLYILRYSSYIFHSRSLSLFHSLNFCFVVVVVLDNVKSIYFVLLYKVLCYVCVCFFNIVYYLCKIINKYNYNYVCI